MNWPKVFLPSNSRELSNSLNFLQLQAGINVIGVVMSVPLVHRHHEGTTCVHALDHGREFVIVVEKEIETAGIAQIVIGSDVIAIVVQIETTRSRNHRVDTEVEAEIVQINEDDVMIVAETRKKKQLNFDSFLPHFAVMFVFQPYHIFSFFFLFSFDTDPTVFVMVQ